MPSLSDSDRLAILKLAREAVFAAVSHRRQIPAPAAPPILLEPRGAFVTLHVRGNLQGCIGVISPRDPLGETIVHCAISAALEDPRFAPLRPDQLPHLAVEVSLLSPMEPIRAEDVIVGTHGLLVERSRNRGLLLPQVATEHHFTPERFLEETCHKAGLPRSAWKEPDTQLFAFTCEILQETEGNPS